MPNASSCFRGSRYDLSGFRVMPCASSCASTKSAIVDASSGRQSTMMSSRYHRHRIPNRRNLRVRTHPKRCQRYGLLAVPIGAQANWKLRFPNVQPRYFRCSGRTLAW